MDDEKRSETAGKKTAVKKLASALYSVIFLLLICFPLTATLWVSPQSLLALPPTEGNLFAAADAGMKAMADALWVKPYAMRAVATVDYALFRHIINERVFAGRKGHLFYKGEQAIDNLLGQYEVPPYVLNLICFAQQATHEALADEGVKYLVVVVPAKEAICTDALPDFLVRENMTSRKTQILQALKERTDVDVLDLTAALRDEQTQHPTYYRTDSHWNYHGAFRAAQEIVRHLNADFPQLPILDRDAYTVSFADVDGLNLSQLSHLDHLLKEEGAPIYHPHHTGWVSMEHMVGYADPGRPALAGEGFAMIRRENPGNVGQPNVMIMGDSFVAGVRDFLSNTFHRYMDYHYLYGRIGLDLVALEQSDVVILMYLESNLERLAIGLEERVMQYALGTLLSFAASGHYTGQPFFTEGLSVREKNFIWTDGPQASAEFRLQEMVASDLQMDIELATVYPSASGGQTVELYVNDVYVDAYDVRGSDTQATLRIPQELLQDNVLRLTLGFPDAMPEPGGERLLALALKSVRIYQVA